jgi:hypothetical protein
MTVYVDPPRYKVGRMVTCHMAADSLVELHTVAEALGIRRWFQDKPGAPHYDICKATRRRAIALGAVESTRRGLLAKAKECAAHEAEPSKEASAPNEANLERLDPVADVGTVRREEVAETVDVGTTGFSAEAEAGSLPTPLSRFAV